MQRLSSGFLISALANLLVSSVLAQDRTGYVYSGPDITASAQLAAIASSSVVMTLCSPTSTGAGIQSAALTTPLQGFPSNGTSFLVLSSGDATAAAGTFTTFESVIAGGPWVPGCSPDGFNCFDVQTTTLSCSSPTGRMKLAFDWTFCTEEIPSFEGTVREFFAAKVTDATGTTNIAKLPNGNAVTTFNMVPFSNHPGGSSSSPAPPAPTPNDVVYNSCLNHLPGVPAETASANLIGPVTLALRVADVMDDVYDSAAFIDNLRIAPRVQIDLKPEGNPNCVNPGNRGQGLPVAILGSANFNVSTINPSTIVYAGAPANYCAQEDVNGDGFLDLVCHFSTQALVIASTDFNANGCAVTNLTGNLLDGIPFSGSDWLCKNAEAQCRSGIPTPPIF